MIELQRVSHHFGERRVLSEVDLTLTERRVAVVGSNGSGKSTFARLLNGLVLPTEGRVQVDGLDTRTQARAVRRKVGFVFQNPDNQIVLPLVEEDVGFGLRGLGLDRAQLAQRVTEVLRRYGLEAFRHHPAHLLSGGHKQLLALSAVLVMEPEYVVFDEPTTLLDLRNKRRVAELIRAMPQRVVMVTHDLELVRDYDRVLVLDEGRVVMDGAPADVLDAYVRAMS